MPMRRLLSLSVLLVASAMAISLSPSVAAATGGTPVALTQEACTAALTRALTAHFNLEGELQLELLRAWTPPALPAADWQVVVTEFPSTAASAMMLRCRLMADGVIAGEQTLTLHAVLWRDVWVTRQPVNTGAQFDPALGGWESRHHQGSWVGRIT